MIELAKRVVACKHWRWMDGMLGLGDIASDNVRVIKVDATTIESYDMVASTNAIVIDGLKRWNYIPDLTDPATLGCLLALVREATGLPVFAGQLISGLWVVRYVSNGLDDGFVNGKWGDTEAEALVCALEAAP